MYFNEKKLLIILLLGIAAALAIIVLDLSRSKPKGKPPHVPSSFVGCGPCVRPPVDVKRWGTGPQGVLVAGTGGHKVRTLQEKHV